MKKQIIAITIIVLVLVIFFGNLGADKRALINALEYRGYVKCADGIYRAREIKEEGFSIIIYDRSFDIKNNHGESHVITLFKRLDGRNVKESEIVELSVWSFDERHFVPVN